MRFQAKKTFNSREFAGTQYVEGMTYTIRPGNTKLADMCQKWLKAKRFTPLEDFSVMGMQFSAGQESYVLPNDDLEILINLKVEEGKAEYSEEVGLITFNIVETGAGQVSGSATKQIVGA